MNVSGIETDSVQRGEVLAHPDQYQPTRRVDARFRLLADSSSPLKHNSEVKFFVGASESMATLRLLQTEELNPGEEGWIQLELRDPVVTVRGDRYIVRRPSPGETLGGGAIVDHQPRGRHRRLDEDVLKSLEALARGTPAEVLFEAALVTGPASLREIVSRSRLEPAAAEAGIQELLEAGSLVPLETGTSSIGSDLLVISLPHWNTMREKISQIVDSYHDQYPLRRGIPREELKSKLRLSARVFNAILNKQISDGSLAGRFSLIAMPSHEITFDSSQQAKVHALMQKFEQNAFSPPGVKEVQQETGEELLNALIEADEFVTVSSDVIFRKTDYDFMVERIRIEIQEKEKITLGEVRDLFKTSRKYAQAILEHLDLIGITVRDRDFRRLRKT